MDIMSTFLKLFVNNACRTLVLMYGIRCNFVTLIIFQTCFSAIALAAGPRIIKKLAVPVVRIMVVFANAPTSI